MISLKISTKIILGYLIILGLVVAINLVAIVELGRTINRHAELDMPKAEISDPSSSFAPPDVAYQEKIRFETMQVVVYQARLLLFSTMLLIIILGMGVTFGSSRWVSSSSLVPQRVLAEVRQVSHQIATEELPGLMAELTARAKGNVLEKYRASAQLLELKSADTPWETTTWGTREVTQIAQSYNQMIPYFHQIEQIFKEKRIYLTELMKVVEKIAEGNLGVTVPISSPDDGLGHALVKMAAALQMAEAQRQRQIERLEALHEIDVLIATNPDLNTVLEFLLKQITNQLQVDAAEILLLNVKDKILVRSTGYGFYMKEISNSALSLDGHSFASIVVKTRQPIKINSLDENTVEENLPIELRKSFKAYYGIPLLVRRTKVVGVLQIFHHDPLAPDEEWFNFLKISADQAAIAINNASQISDLEANVAARTSELEWRALQMRTAAEISRTASSTLDLDTLLQRSVDLIRDGFGLYYDGLFLVDEQRGYAWLRAGTGEAGKIQLARGHKLAVGGTSMIGWCVKNGKARIALDVGEDAVHFNNPFLPNTRSEMALPLITRGAAIGALTVQSDQPQAFNQADITILQTMADQLANAIGNAKLYQQEQKRRLLSDTLSEVARIVSSTLEQQKVLDLIIAQLNNVITYHYATVMLLADNKLTLVAERGKENGAVNYFTIAVDKHALNAVVLHDKKPLLLPDVRYDNRWQESESVLSIRSYINAPLLVQERPIGLLAVGRRDETPYTEEDAEIVFAFANQVAVALEQARLHKYEMQQMEREIEIASQIQKSLLPIDAPKIEGLDISGFSQAASSVGGDFYNYFIFDQEHLAIVVGDVSGKGMQAALLMALSVGLLSNEVRMGIPPSTLLAKMNNLLHPHTRRSKLNSALNYLTIEKWFDDGNLWKLRAGNAGLVAPLVWHKNEAVEWLDLGGLPLGMVSGAEYMELEEWLDPGDVLILSSDGIVEAMNEDGQMYGFSRLADRVASLPSPFAENAHSIQEWILDDLRAFVGKAEPHDDLTLIVVVILESAD